MPDSGEDEIFPIAVDEYWTPVGQEVNELGVDSFDVPVCSCIGH